MKLKLYVGCGKDRREGYVGIDLYAEAADVRAAAWDLPYDDGIVEAIYTSHMIEHLSPKEWELTLVEWRRVLRDGGQLEIRCPNFELYVREYLEGDYEYRQEWGLINIFGWQDRGPGMLTRTGFTVERLRRELPAAGFKVTRCETTRTRQSKGPEYRLTGDIICECVKA